MDYYYEIKQELINNEIHKKVKDYSKNKYELKTYYNVGKLLIEAQGGEKRAKYGDELIKEYSKKLLKECNLKYSVTTLKYMRQFYLYQKSQPSADQLSWSHWIELLSLNNKNIIQFYINLCHSQNLSRNALREKIKNKEYERLDDKAKEKLKNNKNVSLIESIKEPIIIKNKYDTDDIKEKALKELILDDIENFLLELGEGFCFIKSEYKIRIGNNYNYIDLMLFNIKYNCYVVIELKITELKKEHIGQIQTYMNYIDKNIKDNNQNKTVGIIIVRKNNKYIMEYCSDSKIISKEYILV